MVIEYPVLDTGDFRPDQIWFGYPYLQSGYPYEDFQ